jgi:hypothetical protein
MRAVTDNNANQIADYFTAWLADHGEELTVRGRKPTFLLPPAWYVGGTTKAEA